MIKIDLNISGWKHNYGNGNNPEGGVQSSERDRKSR